MAGVGAVNIDVGQAFNFLGKIVDGIIPDKNKAQEMKNEMAKFQLSGDMDQFKQIMQVFVNESASQDKWTSRARPSFLYVMYIYIVTGIPMGILTIFSKENALLLAQGMQVWLSSIPTSLWGVFGACFSVYTIARSYDKSKGVG